MAAVGPVQPLVSSAWPTFSDQNASVGQAVTEAYSGPVTGDHAGGPDTVPGRDPEGGQETGQIPADDIDFVSGGGGSFADQADVFGHSAPVAPVGSGIKAFAGPGALPDTHSYDDGGYARHTQVLMPRMSGWARRVLQSQTYDQESYSYTPEGFKINTPNNRVALDQYVSQDANAYDPRPVDYSERALYANLAYEAQPLTGAQTAYTPSGQLMDMTPMGGQGNAVYVEPDDPQVNTGTAPAYTPAPVFDGGDF